VPLIAGVDVGNATTEVAVLGSGRLLGVGRVPTRGRKGSAESLRAAAALVRRLERRHGWLVDEAVVAPLRATATGTLAAGPAAQPAGRLRLLAAGVATPGGSGGCVGIPVWLGGPPPARPAAPSAARPAAPSAVPPEARPFVVLVPPGLGYASAARRVRDLVAAGTPVGAVLVPGDEGVLVANRIGAGIPVVDQADVAGAASCSLVAVEVRAPGQPLTLVADPVALAAALRLGGGEARDAVTLCRSLVDYSNAVVGCAGTAVPPDHPLERSSHAAGPPPHPGGPSPHPAGPPSHTGGPPPHPAGPPPHPAGPPHPGGPPPHPAEPWVLANGQRMTLREASALLAGWPVGAVTAVSAGPAVTAVDDLFAVDLEAVADAATARRGSLGRAVVAASLHRLPGGAGQAEQAGTLAELLGRPVRCATTEPAAARLGALTTPGARPDALVVDIGAGTIDVIAPGGEVVAAGAGDLLTAAVAQTLGIPAAAAEWVKRGPCLRVDGAQRFEAEDGSHGFLDRPAPAAAAGALAAHGPAGLLPFGRGRSPAEWRAVRLRLKQAVFAVNLRRALAGQADGAGQIIVVGGPAADDELTGVLLRSLPPGVAVGRGNVGGTLAGPPAGHRYAAALGLALAGDGGAGPFNSQK
jgi:hypothetical protein